ncbi:hypothetical protein L1987_35402 [Smallanthus sonchifolius]|uniref:Uncharacterized protein n=1 Tax=Smallanthus sonchifolius TaxID=185202 RepID=A0ACB9HVW4_9ASTR|nr:hypothetical protein L1987_35402 [Smallanthus sonchifolius]
MANDGVVQQTQNNGASGGFEGQWRAVDDLTAKFERTLTTIEESRTTIIGGDYVHIQRRPNNDGAGGDRNYRRPVNRRALAYDGGSFKDEEDQFDYRRNDEADKVFDIMDVPAKQQVKIVAYKLCCGVGAWWYKKAGHKSNEYTNRRHVLLVDEEMEDEYEEDDGEYVDEYAEVEGDPVTFVFALQVLID